MNIKIILDRSSTTVLHDIVYYIIRVYAVFDLGFTRTSLGDENNTAIMFSLDHCAYYFPFHIL